MNQHEMNHAEIDLSETANAIRDDALPWLYRLAQNDSADQVYQQAIDALVDAKEHLEDAMASIADGFGSGA